jgi:ferredoxin-NADP reductase
MRYERWRTLHNVLALLTLLAVFSYGWVAAPSLRALPGRLVWVLLLAAALAAYGHHRVLGPMSRRRRPWRVAEVRRETANVWTLALEPPAGAPRLAYLPGQFQFLTFYRGRGLPVEEHHFTIATGGFEARHASTIKASGDFTATIGMTQPGDAVAVQAPYGRFSYVLHPAERDLAFVAGGIGITPLMAMLRHMRDSGARKDVLLIYANRTEQDIVFRAEIDAMSAGEAPRLRVVHVLSQPGDAWAGERGIVDRGLLARVAPPDLKDRGWYVCGPPAMMAGVLAALAALGVPAGRVHAERFAL